MPYYIKVVSRYGYAPYQGTSYNLPKGNRPGAWHSVSGQLKPCGNGYHVCRPRDIYRWFSAGRRLFLVETSGRHIPSWDKVVCERMRFLRELNLTENFKLAHKYPCTHGTNKLIVEMLIANGIIIKNLPDKLQLHVQSLAREHLTKT